MERVLQYICMDGMALGNFVSSSSSSCSGRFWMGLFFFVGLSHGSMSVTDHSVTQLVLTLR